MACNIVNPLPARRQLELLAPAKDLESGIAAIEHGADAVYIGPPSYGARAAAGNSVEDIARLCVFAHSYGAKVYATVNTLLRNDELPLAGELMSSLADADVDAVLIQDMRLLGLVPERIAVHASTQADNRTAAKVRWLGEHGFRRAVLARELTIEEVAAIHREVPQMELEVFVHGALCVSYSGLCYASEHCFGRSANRGECAQFCRMKFDLLDADGRELQHQRYLLSLKDLNLSMELGRLIEAGAVSFKIEGRLKDISYVKNVTAAYSMLLDQYIDQHPDLYERASRGQCRYTFTPDLNRTFNRGYTTYFANGRAASTANSDSSLASFYTPKAIGMPVGVVDSMRHDSIIVLGNTAFSNGDGLCFFDKGKTLHGFRVNRAVQVSSSAQGHGEKCRLWQLFPQSIPEGLVRGVRLFRSNDQAMDSLLSRPSAERKIPISLTLNATPEGFTLRCGTIVIDFPLEHQQARTSQRENIVAQLSRMGDTPFVCTSVDMAQDFNWFIPSSKLSAMRRMLVDALLNQKQPKVTSVPVGDIPADSGVHHEEGLLMQCRYCLRHEMGYCVRHGGRKAEWQEPLMLRLGDGSTFRLEFDCRRCQMNVWACDD